MNTRVVRQKRRGQAMILIAGAMVALLALVALAVDGGNAFAQRRVAQSAVDGGSMAGTTTMQKIFASNRYANGIYDISSAQGRLVLESIKTTLLANNQGASTVDTDNSANGTFRAYWIDRTGQRYCQCTVGDGTPVHFDNWDGRQGIGAAGVWVQSTVSSPTYFARIVGINNVRSDAHGGAQLGSPAGYNGNIKPNPNPISNGPKLWPITIYTDTINPQGTTTLYNFSTTYSPGNWGVVCFRGSNAATVNCGQNDINDWLQNGFNPATPAVPDGGIHSFGENTTVRPSLPGGEIAYNFFPIGNDGSPNPRATGLWLVPKPGNGISSGASIVETAASEHWHVFLPITDRDNSGGGRTLRYHAINIAEFIVTSADVHGSHNRIDGQFVGFNWNPNQFLFQPGLAGATQSGHVILRLAP